MDLYDFFESRKLHHPLRGGRKPLKLHLTRDRLHQLVPSHDETDAGAVHEADRGKVQRQHARTALDDRLVDPRPDEARAVVIELPLDADGDPVFKVLDFRGHDQCTCLFPKRNNPSFLQR